MAQYEFTEIEVQALIKLIDLAVRYDGLNAAGNAVLLTQKLRTPFSKPTPPNNPPAKEDI